MSWNNYINSTEFTDDQKQEIEEGILSGVNVETYAKPEYLAIQMREIRLGLVEKLDVSYYASPEYDWFQMEEIRRGLEDKIDVTKYADPGIAFDVMRQIREGLESGLDLSDKKNLSAGVLKEYRLAATEGIDISKYIQAGYSEEQLLEIRQALCKGLDIDPYLQIAHRGSAIHEIALGLEQQLDVSMYADLRMNWQQMREIRLGLEKRLDVAKYQNSLFSWQQMREIRLGMEAGIEVDSYASLMYTSKEMEKRRLQLVASCTEMGEINEEEKKEYYDFCLMTDEEDMEAYIILSEKDSRVSKNHILAALQEKGVTYGIDYDVLDELEKNGSSDAIVTVAKGKLPTKGEDAWYEYFFERDVKKKPKLLADGSVDYKNVKWFEVVQKEQKIAYYHAATEGMSGSRVTGESIPGLKGAELPPITGKGFRLLPDQKTYVADTDGKIDYKDGKIEITDMIVVDDLNSASGNVSFNGSVLVRGTIGEGVVVKATKDILVEGFTEAALLEAGGDIILKKGNNAGGKGYIKAGNDVMGNFFENVRVRAGRDIKANYCLNSALYAEGNIEIAGNIGMIAGGTAYAAKGISSHEFGNEAAVPTKITIGREEEFYQKRKAMEQRKNSIERELFLLNNAYQDYQRKYTPEVRNENPLYLKIEDAIYTKNKELEELVQDREALEVEEKKNQNVKVVARGKVYQGVQVTVNGARWNAARTISGVTMKKKDNAVFVYRNI